MAISFVSGDGNNFIRLVAESGEGDSWDNAFSFEKIVDYFKNNPISAISMPSDGDLTEGHGDWAGGVASPADGNFAIDASTVAVENITGFNSSGTLVWLKDDYINGYPNYIDYTGVSGNSFTGCTWDKFYGDYMMDIDDGEWVWQYRKDTISNDTTDKQVGSNSLVYTHDNDGSNAVIMWVANLESWSEGIDAYCAEELRFWIKPSSPNITLEEVVVRDWYKYSNGRVFYYGNHWTGEESAGEGFNLSSGSWTENRIKIREYGMDSKYGVRDWMHRVSMIAFRFSGLQNGDTIKIDGVRFYLDDPNPREIKTNVYLFPIQIYNYGVQNQDFYFWDYGKTIIFNQLVDDLFRHYERDYRSYLRFGRPGSVSDNEQPMGLVFFWNTWCGGNTFFYFEGNSADDESKKLRLQVDGLRVMASHPTLDGPQWRGRFLYVDESYMRNSQFEEIGDWFWEGYSEIVNIVLWGHRYTPWYPPSEDATIKDVKIWLNQNYMWIDEGTLRDSEVVSAREGTIWFNQRDYGATSNRTTTFIDWTFPDGFFDSSHDYQARQRSTYTAYSCILRIGNSVKIKVVDKDGNPIENATVTCKDKDGSTAWTESTDANGETSKHDIIHREWITSSGERTIYMDTPDNYYYPYTIKIAKAGYQTYEFPIPTDEKIDWTITLKKIKINIDNEVIA